MIELGELEAHHAEFENRKVRVAAISLEDQKTAELTKKDFPNLIIVADADKKLAHALGLIHPASAHDGGDTAAPTTILVDGKGIVRWIYRSESFMARLSPAEVLEAVNKHLPGR